MPMRQPTTPTEEETLQTISAVTLSVCSMRAEGQWVDARMAQALEQRALADEVEQLLLALDQSRAQTLHGDRPRRPPRLPQLRLLDPREGAFPQVTHLQSARFMSRSRFRRALLRVRATPLELGCNPSMRFDMQGRGYRAVTSPAALLCGRSLRSSLLRVDANRAE